MTLAPGLPRRPETATISVVEALPVTDGDLVARVATGDRVAFEELYRRYARSVLGLALRRIGDRGRAEDALQETFTSIWRSARRYDPAQGPVAPWLYTVARNAVTDVLRRTPEASVGEAPDVPEVGRGPAEQAEDGWVAWQVHRAVALLPDDERVVIELAYWGGLSQSEVAAFLGIPLGTVKTRTRSALARLAVELDGRGL